MDCWGQYVCGDKHTDGNGEIDMEVKSMLKSLKATIKIGLLAFILLVSTQSTLTATDIKMGDTGEDVKQLLTLLLAF